ncbi:MAG: hypothetical protein HOV87_33905 [Catenulispora sp.]|nr:hypothetical protein [Catenulispora sp.]
MNIRIERVAVPAMLPNRQNRRRLLRGLPHGLAGARRLAAHIMLRPSAEAGAALAPKPTRRGTSTLALAAALAIPALPGPAAAATEHVSQVASAASATTVIAPAPLVRHHLPEDPGFSEPGAITFQSWAASGWSLSGPYRTVDPRCLVIPHHHRCTPWLYHPDAPVRLTGPEAFPDGHPVLDAALPVAHVSPRAADEPEGFDPAPASIPDSPRPEPSSDPQSDESTTAQDGARHRGMAPILTESPARPAVAGPMSSSCLRAAYLVGKDRRMLAHLRPAVDAMGVVLGHRHAACAAMVDYLSRARA